MRQYLHIVKIAFMVFPFLALLITIPYMIKEYRKYGSITNLKAIIFYSFVLYMLAAYFMVIMPLPSRSEVALMTQPFKQLRPFATIMSMFQNSTFVINDFSTYFKALKNPAVYTLIFNFLLTFPFGVYLRYYFKRKWWQVFLLSFSLSMFFELTQLSGLYGIYPRPYRLFDVDDLIVNTIGGMLGFWFCPLFTIFLPKRERLDEKAYYKGLTRVSFSRRLLSLIIDLFIFSCFYFIFIYILKFKSIIGNLLIFKYAFMIYYVISISISNGYSIGKMIVNIRLIDNTKRISFKKIFLRYFYFMFFIFTIWEVLICLTMFIDNFDVRLIIYIILGFIYFVFLFKLFIDVVTKKNHFFYEKWSKTENKNLSVKK